MASLIGLYDSGLGGLSVVREVRKILPHHDLYYLADTAFCPYGPRPSEEVRERARACTRWLMAQGASLLVVACNTASSAALETLRSEFSLPVVGMEPGVKPAIAATRTRHIGVLATNGTLNGGRFASLLQRYAKDVNVQTVPCPSLVEQVESGDTDGPRTRNLLLHCLTSLKSNDVDTIVLGCTHFHFVAPLLSRLAGPGVTIIDTAPAVARQVHRIVSDGRMEPGKGTIRCATTGDPSSVHPVLTRIWGGTLPLIHANC